MTVNITRDEIPVMIYYDYKNKKLSQQECPESLQKTFGDSCITRAIVYNCYADFYWERDHSKDMNFVLVD